jgi:4-hydroxy-3-polyprenylbenzoate decarboxylase
MSVGIAETVKLVALVVVSESSFLYPCLFENFSRRVNKMPYKSVREFLESVEKKGDLKIIEGANWDIELGAIIELMAEKKGPALIFDRIKDYPPGRRIAANLYQTYKRFCIALGVSEDTPKLELVKMFRGMDLNKLIKPVEVKTGPVMTNVRFDKDVNLLEFPVPKYHEKDGGRYMGTGHIVITKDPDSDWVNVGVQRCMVQDEKTLSIYFAPGKHGRIIRDKYFSMGKRCPVVLALGPEPILYMAAVLSVPQGISEFDYAGMIKGEPIEVIKGEITGLPFPANDEIVIEGEMVPPEEDKKLEGPFGEWTGYYGGGKGYEATIKVKAVYFRDNPILVASPPLKPSLWMFAGFPVPITCAPATWDALEAAGVTGIKGVWYLEGGGERFIPVVSIKQDHPGHAKQAAMIVAGCHGSAYMSRIIIIVDDDIDPTNTDEVLWAIATRCDILNSIEIIKGTWSGRLDPILSPEKREMGDFTTPKLIIDACRPFHWKEKFPPVNEISLELREKILEKWGKKLGLA